MRGALHLVAPDTGPALLSLIAAAKPWARPGWDRYFDMNEARWSAYFDTVRRALDGTTLSREELVAAIAATPGLGHLADGLRSGWGTLLKPLAWSGELCFGPSRGTRVTFRRPADASTEWTGLPAPEDAAPVAVEAYFGAYGPATLEAFGHWMGGGWLRKRALREMVDAHGSSRLVEVDVEGRRAFVLAEHVDRTGRRASQLRRPAPPELRRLGPRPRLARRASRAAGSARGREPPGRLDLADRRRRRRCRRHLAARRRAPRSRLVPGSRRPPGRQARSRSRSSIQHRRSSAIADASPARRESAPNEPGTAQIGSPAPETPAADGRRWQGGREHRKRAHPQMRERGAQRPTRPASSRCGGGGRLDVEAGPQPGLDVEAQEREGGVGQRTSLGATGITAWIRVPMPG